MMAKGRVSSQFSVLGSQLSNAELLKTLERGDRWHQYQAQRELARRPTDRIMEEPAVASESDLFGEQGKHGYDHFRVAWQMHMIHEQPNEQLRLGLHTSKDAALRGLAARCLAQWYPVDDGDYNLRTLAWDDSPAVRLEAVVAAAKIDSPVAIKAALEVLDKPMDSFIERALWLAVHATAPQWKKPPFEILNSLPPKHLAFLVEKEGSAELLGVVRSMLAQKGESMPPETRRGLLAALVRKGEPGDMLMALKLGVKDQAVLEDLAAAAAQRGFKTPEGAEPVLLGVLKDGNEAQKAAACALVGAWRLKSAEAVMSGLVEADGGVRAPALMALAKLGEPAETFEKLAKDTQQPWGVRTAALTVLAEKKPVLAGQLAAASLLSITDAETMRAWLVPLLPREAALGALAKALDEKPCSAEAAKLAMTTLTAAGRGDAVLTTAFGKILGVKNTVPAYDAAWVAALAAEVKAHGDAAKGKAVFNAPLSGCIACHKIGGQGGIVGPELDAVGRGVPVELLIEAVVWPNRQIKEGYVATTLTLKDGRKLQGYKVSEAGGEMQLRELASGQTSRFTPAQIAERQEAGSLMPEGLIMNMTREELRDLVAYLAGLGR